MLFIFDEKFILMKFWVVYVLQIFWVLFEDRESYICIGIERLKFIVERLKG